MSRYSIGVDFGTLSGRTVLVDVSNGEEIAVSVFEYKHGVMDKELPDGTPLGVDWALQHPQDYLDVFMYTIPDVMQKASVSADQIIGVGIDFTACTILPVKADGTPLCFMNEYCRRPNAWVKLWKHHAAQDEANMLNEVAEKRGEKFLKRYGGKISSEWMIPKIWQTLDEDPDIYYAADRFLEAADWVVWQLKSSPAIGSGIRPGCESYGWLLDAKGNCAYITAYNRELAAHPDGKNIVVMDKTCLCTHMRNFKCWTCGHYTYRLKDTTRRLADGSYQMLSAEHVFRDYQFSTDHQIALPA